MLLNGILKNVNEDVWNHLKCLKGDTDNGQAVLLCCLKLNSVVALCTFYDLSQ